MSDLADKARGLITAASAASAVPTGELPSIASAILARIIVSKAKKQHPHNLLLQGIDLDAEIPDWNDIRTAMKVVIRTLG